MAAWLSMAAAFSVATIAAAGRQPAFVTAVSSVAGRVRPAAGYLKLVCMFLACPVCAI